MKKLLLIGLMAGSLPVVCSEESNYQEVKSLINAHEAKISDCRLQLRRDEVNKAMSRDPKYSTLTRGVSCIGALVAGAVAQWRYASKSYSFKALMLPVGYIVGLHVGRALDKVYDFSLKHQISSGEQAVADLKKRFSSKQFARYNQEALLSFHNHNKEERLSAQKFAAETLAKLEKVK